MHPFHSILAVALQNAGCSVQTVIHQCADDSGILRVVADGRVYSVHFDPSENED